jgi:hypothetical protein
LGGIALASMLNERRAHGAAPSAAPGGPAPIADPMAPRPTHFPARAKNVIYLFMAGGPSQLDLFDYKPRLAALNGQPVPESLIAGKRFAFMDTSHGTKLLGSRRAFAQHGRSGAWVSDLFPYTAGVVDDITLLKSCAADLFNHAPAKLFMNTGSGQFGRPSMGSWITYGLGSESNNLPGFVVLQSGPRGPRGGAVNWGTGFLPTTYQGVPFRGNGDPILTLTSPKGITATRQRQTAFAYRKDTSAWGQRSTTCQRSTTTNCRASCERTSQHTTASSRAATKQPRSNRADCRLRDLSRNAAARQRAHDRRAATDVGPVADDHARGDAALHHRSAQCSGVEVHETLVHHGGALCQMSSESNPVCVGDPYPGGHHVVDHPRELVHAVDRHRAASAQSQTHRFEAFDATGTVVGPDHVRQGAEDAIEVAPVRFDQTVREQV